jgi:hypothetical protein
MLLNVLAPILRSVQFSLGLGCVLCGSRHHVTCRTVLGVCGILYASFFRFLGCFRRSNQEAGTLDDSPQCSVPLQPISDQIVLDPVYPTSSPTLPFASSE